MYTSKIIDRNLSFSFVCKNVDERNGNNIDKLKNMK